MARNMIVRLGIDASDFQKKMQQAGASAESTGKRIKKSMSMDNLGVEAAKIMGWTGAGTAIGSINAGNIDVARNQIGTLKSYRDQLADAGFDDELFGLVSDRIKALEYDLNEYAQSLSRTADAEKDAAEGADNLGDEARKTEPPVSRASRTLREMGNSGRRLSIIPGFLRRIRDSAHSSNGGLEKMVRTIRNVSVVSFGLRIVRGLFGELGTIVRNYISQDAQLQAQVNGLSASMGNALAPAIHLVTNALSYVLPYVVGVSNAIGQLMGNLFGGGWSAAAAGANKTAAATGGAAKAQKEMNKQLLSFDQINRMDNQKDPGDGSGGGKAVAPIAAKTPVWAERLKNTFTDLFKSAEFQAANTGGKIGMVLNTAIGEAASALKNVDFSDAGSALAENFNSMVGAIDWNAAGRLAGMALTALPLTLIGFAQNADWAMIGQSVSQFLMSSLGTVSERLRSVDWVQLGRALKIFVRNIDYAGIAQGLGTAFGFALGTIGATLWGMISEPWHSFVATWLENSEKAGGDVVAGLMIGLRDGTVRLVSGLWSNVLRPIIDGIKEGFGIHSPSTVFAEIGANCMAGLGNGFATGMEWIQQKLEELKARVMIAADTLKNAFSFSWSLPHLRLPHLSVDWDPVDNVLANFFGVTAFPRLSVQWFAKGGILDGAQIFGRMGSTLLGGGERGREAILPLDTNTGWMDVLANRIAQSLSVDSGGDVNATINLVLDGDVLTTYVMKGIRRRARAGTSTI